MSAMLLLIQKEEGAFVKKARAIYEFIEDYAYFACSAIIVLEDYTMTDAEDNYRQLIQAFDIYMEYYDKMDKGVRDGRFSEDAADVCLRTYLNWLREKSSKNFKNKMKDRLATTLSSGSDDLDIKRKVEEEFSKIDLSNFNTADLQKKLKDIRNIEEKFMGE